MFAFKGFIAVGVAACLTSSAAFALTADQVWKDWQANAKGVGLLLSADPATTAGGQLALRNLQLAMEDDVIFRLTDMTLTETPEGAVTVGLPASFDLAPPQTEDVTLSVKVAHTGLAITVTEPAPGARAYTYDADLLNISGNFVEMVDIFDGGEKQPNSSDFTWELVNFSGNYGDTPGTNRSFAASFIAKDMKLDLTQSSPFSGQSTQASTAQDFAMNGTFTLPATFDLMAMTGPGQMADALRDGLSATLDFSQGPGTSDQSVTSEFFSFGAKISGNGSNFRIQFDKTGMVLAGTSLPVNATVTSPEMPFPQLDIAFGDTAMEFKFPLVGPEVQDFRYMVKFDNFSINDAAWDAFDPTAVLARTPIVLDIDVTGRTSLDLFALIQASDDGTAPPVPQVERADIVRMLVSGAGAEFMGTGAFTFDNSLGYPMPRGNADLTVKGVNKMVDALITLGVITSDDAMGARMAMALILEPTAEPDVMTSKIEAREDGGLYVNGQRMQ
jgi:Uncharacterized protein conserved in bacteria (DUF2125)